MKYRCIGNSGLKVSEIGLGGNNFGWRLDEKESIEIVNSAMEYGINFIDTAELYSRGESEAIIGKAVKGKRSRVVIATKFGMPMFVGPERQGGSRGYIMQAVELSLKRLGTDYIDLYYIHMPDPVTPVEETLRALQDLVTSGKVRYIACSNYPAWRLCDALWTSRQDNLTPFIAVQSRYNLLDRSVERELVPCCQSHGVGLIPWGPLASGFLTGKYKAGQQMTEEMRLAKPNPSYVDVISDENYKKLAVYEKLAAEWQHTVGELAVAWLLSHDWIPSVIAGAMSKEQLAMNIAAADWELPQDALKALDAETDN